MPTMKDISRLAGVSYGTVSNVLNKKGNVSLEKIRLVEEAAAQLGYYRNEIASALRANKKDEIALIVPTISNSKICNIYNLLLKKLNQLGYKLNLCITEFNGEFEKDQFKLLTATNKIFIIWTSLSFPEEFYQASNFKQKIIFLNVDNKMDKKTIYSINFDQFELARDFSNYISEHQYKKVLFFSDYKINKQAYTVPFDLVVCQQPFNLPQAIESLCSNDYDLIIVSNMEKYESIISAMKILQKDNIKDIILISDSYSNYHIDSVQYLQNSDGLIEKTVEIITQKENSNNVILANDGFSSTKKDQSGDELFINILMIESPATTALLKIKPFIEKQLGFKTNIDVIQYNQYEIIMQQQTIDKYDLIRIDMAYLPDIAKKIFKPLDNRFAKFIDQFIENLNEYIYTDNQLYSLPFDISCMIMLYRSDILNNQLIQREYYEQTKTAIVPTDFQEYNKLEQFFQQNYRGIFQPSTVCSGSNITCGNEFIIRIQSNQIIKDDQLNFDNPAVKEALDSYLKSVSFSKNRQNNFWDEVIKEYSEGKTIMAISYSNYIHMLKSYNNDLLYKTSYTFPPTKKSLIGGGVIGLSKYTNKDELCYQFLKILYDEKIGKLLTHLGATMPMKSIYNDINLNFVYPWLELIPQVLNNHSYRRYHNSQKLSTIEYEKKIGKLVRLEIAKYK